MNAFEEELVVVGKKHLLDAMIAFSRYSTVMIVLAWVCVRLRGACERGSVPSQRLACPMTCFPNDLLAFPMTCLSDYVCIG
jgi:hypothetical protein